MDRPIDVDELDWDEGNRNKCQKHGVTIAQIEQVLDGEFFVAEDPQHSLVERRFKVVGPDDDGRTIFIIMTLRPSGDQILARPISARYMHAKEMRRYEQTLADPE